MAEPPKFRPYDAFFDFYLRQHNPANRRLPDAGPDAHRPLARAAAITQHIRTHYAPVDTSWRVGKRELVPATGQ